ITKGLDKYSRSEKKELKKKVQEKIEEFEGKNIKALSSTDQESRMMKNHSSIDYCYNAQGVVDEKNQIVVGAKVTNDETDSHQMTRMLDEAKSNCNKKSKETLVDGGYFSGSELKKAEEKGYSVLTPGSKKVGKSGKKGQNPEFSKNKFRYDSKEDVYICPLGERLKYMYTSNPKSRDYPIRRYGCKNKDCPNRNDCSKDKGGRKIDRTPFDDAIYRQITKSKLDNNKELLKQRKKIVEPLFGWIKHNNGFNRWLYRGLKNVDAQWNLVCTGVNLSKLFKVWKGNRLVL
ncbi:MAG: transposase, partial [Candidatus Aminicenantes bacterium]|nr:transposase [Candidatus Aminicenantes bacterium]